MRPYLTILLFAFSAFASDHSALNGTWTLVPAKSDFAGQPVVQTGTVTIADREGIIIVSRSFVYAGATETFFYSDVTDSEHNATIRTGKDLKTKTRWDHDVLKVTTTQSGAVTLESYALAADGIHDGQRRKAGAQADHASSSSASRGLRSTPKPVDFTAIAFRWLAFPQRFEMRHRFALFRQL